MLRWSVVLVVAGKGRRGALHPSGSSVNVVGVTIDYFEAYKSQRFYLISEGSRNRQVHLADINHLFTFHVAQSFDTHATAF